MADFRAGFFRILQPKLLLMEFPQYRRYKNGASLFRIDSPTRFEEIRKLGNRWLVRAYEVKILPDRNLVNDLLFDYQGFADLVDSEAYEAVRAVAVPE